VASLLDKIPNFGHLTRTCEIFGVKELVFPKKSILNDPEFKAVSVTAEKWIPIKEVKANDLKPYLNLKKKEGFSVIIILII
jgi:tRNA guanosine-2'-O-methyltransferase